MMKVYYYKFIPPYLAIFPGVVSVFFLRAAIGIFRSCLVCRVHFFDGLIRD